MKKIIYIYLISFISMTYSKSVSSYIIEQNLILDINTNYNSYLNRNQSSNKTLSSIHRNGEYVYSNGFESTDEQWIFKGQWFENNIDCYEGAMCALCPNNDNSLGTISSLISPEINIPVIDLGEIIQFSFWIHNLMPDFDGDGNGALEDYFSVSILDIDDIAWQVSSFEAYDDFSYWCGKETANYTGYQNRWVQYLDTPLISLPDEIGSHDFLKLNVNMKWNIENADGALQSGIADIDGWDQALVMISLDNGITFNPIESDNHDYDFQCGFGAVFNDLGCLPGWSGNQEWKEFEFNLKQNYIGEDVIIRFAFISDECYATLDDCENNSINSQLTGFFVDNIQVVESLVSGENIIHFIDDANSDIQMITSGGVWNDQFYDYADLSSPGVNGWEEYMPGDPFIPENSDSESTNVLLDLSDYQGKKIKFRFQVKYDENHDGGQGQGLFIDYLNISKGPNATYPPPTGLNIEVSDNQIILVWDDMNYNGDMDYIFDNNSFSEEGVISLDNNTAYVGQLFQVPGSSSINNVSIYNTNSSGIQTNIGFFSSFGGIYNSTPDATIPITLYDEGWNIYDLSEESLEFTNWFIIGYEFGNDIEAVSDLTAHPSLLSYINLGGWNSWYEVAIGELQMPAGNWGIRSNINRTSPNVTYNIYQNGDLIASNIATNSHSIDDFDYNQIYEFNLTASYPNDNVSDFSNSFLITIISELSQEFQWDDNSPESYYDPNLNDLLAVSFNSNAQTLEAIKWYQVGTGGIFKFNVYDENNGLDGEPLYSSGFITGDNINGFNSGWNVYDLSDENISLDEGNFFIEFQLYSASPTFGVDTTINQFKSFINLSSSQEWQNYNGNFMIRPLLSCGDNSSSCEICGCDNICSSPGLYDDCGICGGDNSNCLDCADIPNGNSMFDECGVCDDDASNDCTQDCAGNWGGTAIFYDECNVCSDDENFQCFDECEEGIVMDCLGSCGGNAEIDECGICDIDESNNCLSDCTTNQDDCNGIWDGSLCWGGTNSLDACGECGGDNTSCTGCMDSEATNTGASLDAICYYFDNDGLLVNNECLIPCFGCCNYTSSNSNNLFIDDFRINNIFPNPFNPKTNIEYQLPESGDIDISIYNIRGNKVLSKNENKNMGIYSFTWDATGHVSGIYFLVLKFNKTIINRKLLLIK